MTPGGSVPSILYADDDLIVADKPEGIASIQAQGHHNLISVLGKEWGPLLPVHRLDLDVSGVIVYARNRSSHRHLNLLFSSREVGKTYLALVWGHMEAESGRYTFRIRQFGSGRMGIDETRGKEAETDWECLHRFSEYSLLRLSPKTGRRHQLRVHLYTAGHPIAGDRRYGPPGQAAVFPRLMLHARSITFMPLSGQALTVTAPVPDTFLVNLPSEGPQLFEAGDCF